MKEERGEKNKTSIEEKNLGTNDKKHKQRAVRKGK
jgi:hypothetical protein